MKRNFRFYKNAEGNWFIDLPEWKGDAEDLQMIQGADKWLDLLGNGKLHLNVTIADTEFENAEFLTLIRIGEPNLGSGGNYYLEQYKGEPVKLKLWFCEITGFLFGTYPQRIFFSVADSVD